MAKKKSASRSSKQSRSRAANRGAASRRRIVILPEGMGEEPRLSQEVFFLVDFS
ncbi:MAG: hypothetical protein O7H41_06795 [Planctomycetota bacterium]|nr:hypothetical protein [Planctomycetota bacterium]